MSGNSLLHYDWDKSKILVLAKQGQVPTKARDVVKAPYVFEFLEFSEQNYRAHLRSFGFGAKMIDTVYSRYHDLFEQSD